MNITLKDIRENNYNMNVRYDAESISRNIQNNVNLNSDPLLENENMNITNNKVMNITNNTQNKSNDCCITCYKILAILFCSLMTVYFIIYFAALSH